MVNMTELNILKLLASRNDVNWTWYNLDRAMTGRNMEGVGHVARHVTNLSNEGLVFFEDSGHPSMPYYRLSDKGYKLLQEVKDEQVD